MGSDIELLDEVPSPRPLSSQQNFEATRCRNQICARRRKLDGDELDGCHNTIKELRAAVADLMRTKDKYKKKFKEMEEAKKLLEQDFEAYQEQMEVAHTVSAYEVDDSLLRRHASAADYLPHEDEENSLCYQEPVSSITIQANTHRQRAHIPASVHKILESTFQNTPVMNGQKRKKLCGLTNLSEAQVINWFMERSSKETEVVQGFKKSKTIKECFQQQVKKRREDVWLRKQNARRNESSSARLLSKISSPDIVDITFSPPKLTHQQDSWTNHSHSSYSQQDFFVNNYFADQDPEEPLSASNSSIDILGLSPTDSTPVLAPKKTCLSRTYKKMLSSTSKTTFKQNRKSC